MTSTNPFRVVTIDTDGVAKQTDFQVGPDGLLPHLQQAVGGLVDVVSLSPSLDMWLNEEGLVYGLPFNSVATEIAAHFGFDHQPYVGTAVFTAGVDAEGESLAIDDAAAAALLALAEVARA